MYILQLHGPPYLQAEWEGQGRVNFGEYESAPTLPLHCYLLRGIMKWLHRYVVSMLKIYLPEPDCSYILRIFVMVIK